MNEERIDKVSNSNNNTFERRYHGKVLAIKQ